MAEIARKTNGKKLVSKGGDAPCSGGMRVAMVEVTTGVGETSGTVTMATDFGAAGATNGVVAASGIATFLASPVGVTIQQDTGTVVANASVTAAGVVTTGAIVAEKNYWVIAFCV